MKPYNRNLVKDTITHINRKQNLSQYGKNDVWSIGPNLIYNTAKCLWYAQHSTTNPNKMSEILMSVLNNIHFKILIFKQCYNIFGIMSVLNQQFAMNSFLAQKKGANLILIVAQRTCFCIQCSTMPIISDRPAVSPVFRSNSSPEPQKWYR